MPYREPAPGYDDATAQVNRLPFVGGHRVVQQAPVDDALAKRQAAPEVEEARRSVNGDEV
jgi:hypothetical protein